MLDKATPEPAADAAVRAYLHETLGISPKVRAWLGAGKLPYFLQDTFEIRELRLLDRQVLLAIDKRPDKPGLANVRGQVDKLRQLAGMPVVYVTATLASYERKRLIADYQKRLEHPYIAAAKGYIDDVIDPVETRTKIAHALEMLRTKSVSVLPTKHGNMPL